MSRNYLSFHDHEISRIGFGCWQLAGDYDLNGRPNGYGAIDPDEAVRAIHLALANGINFFDTAIGYGFGKSELVLGAALKSYTGNGNGQPFVCTKYGMVLDSEGDNDDFSAVNFVESIEGSLGRLQTDSLGIMLLHNPPDDFNFSALDIAAFEQLVDTGKILAYGVSCRTQKGVANVLNQGFGSVIEAVYNPLDRRYEKHFSDPQYKDRYVFICRVPLSSGFITPRTLSADRSFPTNDIRNTFSREQVEWVISSVRKLAFLQELEGGISVSALRFQLSNPYNTVTIPGIKNTKQANDAILAMRLGPLSTDVINDIAEAVPEVFYKWR
ncbi:MAG: aldo/keto reductase [Verrucomicrobia bacterium]|nr:MAG: aldo/keto reductase [Verrucomicrobiota bacterium]